MNTLKISLVLLTLIPLSGCSVYKESFKCQAQDGLGCRSVTEVNSLVDQGWPDRDPLKKDKKKCDFFSRVCSSKSSKVAPSLETADVGLLHPPSSLFSQPSFRIWIAPFKRDNHYWDEQLVYPEREPNSPKTLIDQEPT